MVDRSIVERCMQSVSVDLLQAKTHALCVDGTSATRKSSMMLSTGRPVRKVSIAFYNNNKNYRSVSLKCLSFLGSVVREFCEH